MNGVVVELKIEWLLLTALLLDEIDRFLGKDFSIIAGLSTGVLEVLPDQCGVVELTRPVIVAIIIVEAVIQWVLCVDDRAVIAGFPDPVIHLGLAVS